MSESELRKMVSHACKVLYSAGQEHFYLGHVSARELGSEKIWVKPSGLGLGEIEPDDIVACDLDCHQLTGNRPLHQEMPIHTEIYRRRPDVACVVHTHPFYAAAYASAHANFEMVSQDSVLFAGGIGHYDSALLVVTREQGQRLAASLGDGNVVVMKNHGIAIADSSVERAIFLALSFDRSLRMQHAAAQFGEVDPISVSEVSEMNHYFARSYGGRVETMWNYLVRQAALATRSDRRPSVLDRGPVTLCRCWTRTS
jgi:L-fuculose-phosphate aldolase